MEVFDVRGVPVARRHALIVARLEALGGDTLLIRTDHNPRPLRFELERRFAGRFVWDEREAGESVWEVRVVEARRDPDEIKTLLRRSAVFYRAPSTVLTALASRARSASIRRHRAIAHQDIRWPYLGMIAGGIVDAVLLTSSGKELAVQEYVAADIFGECELLDGGATLLRYEARSTDTSVVLFPTDAVGAAMEADVGVARAISRLAAQRARLYCKFVAIAMGSPTAVRVATVLLPYAGPMVGMSDALEPLPSMTQVELARLAGTAKEVVNRALSDLESLGALRRQFGHVVRLDRQRLSDILEHQPPK
ncbi:MAG TPA: DUF2249 domain-containing protein [Candidatus Baltobacteraceae bacterium]